MKNLFYISKWIFVKEWFTFDEYTGLKCSKMKVGEVEGMLHLMKWFRDHKFYKICDSLKRRLIGSGTTYKENTKKSGQFHLVDRLDLRIKNGHFYLYSGIEGDDFHYSTEYTTLTKLEKRLTLINI